MKKIEETRLVNAFKEKDSFSRKELFEFFLQNEGLLNEGTFGWRIHDLKRKKLISEIERGRYTLKQKSLYKPPINDAVIKLANIFTSNYRDAKYCVWDIGWLNDFTIHQFNRELFIFETEKDLEESIGHTLSDNGYSVIWSLRGSLVSWTNVSLPVVVLPLVTRAPIKKNESETRKVSVPTLEKILVDIYKDEKIFGFIQGNEMERIFENALNRYSINYTTFFGYAKRRGKEDALHAYLSGHFPEIYKHINQ